MKLKKLLSVAILLASALGVNAQTDVTSTYLVNADFSDGTIITPGVCTYAKDKASNGTTFANLVDVQGWTVNGNGDGSAGGLFTIGGGAWLGGNHATRKAPATNSDGEIEGNVLGIVSCWGGEPRYTQSLTLLAGTYTLVVPVYNSGAPKTPINPLAKNFIGFETDGGDKYYATTTQYPVGQWKYEFITFTLGAEATGKVSIGCKIEGSSNNANHLFISGLTLFEGEVNAAEYEAQKAAARVKGEWQAALNAANTALNDANYTCVVGSERTDLQTEMEKAEPTTADGYTEAKEALITATNAFTAAKASYDALEEMKDVAGTYNLAYASAEKKTALDEACGAVPVSAGDATAKTEAIKTALRAYIESHGMAEGVDGAVDMTSKIVNASDPTNNDGWTWTGNKNNPASNEAWTDASGSNTHSYFDGGNWGATGWTTTMSQEITVPAGRYLLTAIGRAATGVTFTMTVGENTVNLPNVGNAGNIFDRGWNDTSIEFETPGKAVEESVTITLKATTGAQYQWFSVGKFRLIQLEAIEILNATDDEYAALESAIATAESKILGFDEGEYAPYNNVAALQALAAAKAIDTEIDNTSEVVNAATGALNSAVWTENAAEVSAINLAATYDAGNKDGDNRVFAPGWGKAGGDNAYNTRLIQGSSGNAGMDAIDGALGLFTKFGTDYGKESGYTMPLNENTVYKFSFKFGAWGENKNITSRFAIMDPNGNTIDITPSSFTYNQNSGLANENVNAWFDYVGVFTTTSAGDYVLTMTKDDNGQQRQIIMGNVSLVKAPVVEANMTITEAGWATFIAPFEVEIPEGVTAYTVEGVKVDNYLNKAAIETGVIPANTPVLLEGAVMDKTFSGQNTATQDTYGDVLVGNVSGVTKNVPDNGESFVLLKQDGNLGFYKVASDDITVSNNRCYLNVPAGGEIKAFFFDDDATGINGIADDATVVERYNAAGMKVAAPVKGLNIVKLSNGKVQKILVK